MLRVVVCVRALARRLFHVVSQRAASTGESYGSIPSSDPLADTDGGVGPVHTAPAPVVGGAAGSAGGAGGASSGASDDVEGAPTSAAAAADATDSMIVWEWMGDGGTWNPYREETSAELEALLVAPEGTDRSIVKVAGRTPYILDVAALTQMNTQTGTTRAMRRRVLTGEERDAMVAAQLARETGVPAVMGGRRGRERTRSLDSTSSSSASASARPWTRGPGGRKLRELLPGVLGNYGAHTRIMRCFADPAAEEYPGSSAVARDVMAIAAARRLADVYESLSATARAGVLAGPRLADAVAMLRAANAKPHEKCREAVMTLLLRAVADEATAAAMRSSECVDAICTAMQATPSRRVQRIGAQVLNALAFDMESRGWLVDSTAVIETLGLISNTIVETIDAGNAANEDQHLTMEATAHIAEKFAAAADVRHLLPGSARFMQIWECCARYPRRDCLRCAAVTLQHLVEHRGFADQILRDPDTFKLLLLLRQERAEGAGREEATLVLRRLQEQHPVMKAIDMFYFSAHSSRRAHLQRVISCGGDPNVRIANFFPDYAATAELLLEELMTERRATPLKVAVVARNWPAAILLIRAGADVTATDETGASPLQIAEAVIADSAPTAGDLASAMEFVRLARQQQAAAFPSDDRVGRAMNTFLTRRRHVTEASARGGASPPVQRRRPSGRARAFGGPASRESEPPEERESAGLRVDEVGAGGAEVAMLGSGGAAVRGGSAAARRRARQRTHARAAPRAARAAGGAAAAMDSRAAIGVTLLRRQLS